MKKTLIALLVCCTSAGAVFSQQADIPILPFEEYLEAVRQYHPDVQRIKLLRDRSAAELLSARGYFDPVVDLNYSDKHFDDQRYYRIGEAGIRWPTRLLGLQLEGGYRWADGALLNPENKQPDPGQTFLGLKLPLLSGLTTDPGRTAMARARLLAQTNEQELAYQVNELLYYAATDYLHWSYYHRRVELLESATRLTRQRLDQTRQGYELGDLAAVDTLETYTQLVGRQAELRRAQRELAQARLHVLAAYWRAEDVPEPLDTPHRPMDLPLLAEQAHWQQSWSDAQLQAHPAVQRLLLNRQDLQLDEQLKRQKLLPKLDVKYQFLAYGLDFSRSSPSVDQPALSDLLLRDYSLGIDFRMPLLLRQARGQLALNTIKQRETDRYLDQVARELRADYQATRQQQALSEDERRLWQLNVDNYRRLLDAELTDFNLGESSVFLLNTRENKLLEAELKLAKARYEWLKLQLRMRYVMGQWQ